MRMIKCDPQPEKTEICMTIYKDPYQIFHFFANEKPIYAPAYVSPDGKANWELRRIDNVWYWVKEG